MPIGQKLVEHYPKQVFDLIILGFLTLLAIKLVFDILF